MIFSQYGVYLVLAVLMAGSWLLADFFEEELKEPVTLVAHSPDYYSNGYYKKEMTQQGLLKNELTADKMIHYSDDGKTYLAQPVMTLYNSDTPPWVIRSKKGVLEADGDHLQLVGKVNITREGTKDIRAFVLNSLDMKVKLSTSYAETKKWAEIIDAQNRTQGIGLKITFTEPVRINFLSKVKGRYEFN